MKNLILAALLALFAASASAGTTVSNLLTYASVNNTTNNGGTVLLGTAYIATTPTFNIQSGGLANTNALVVNIQYGLDTNTFTTVATYRQSVTNAMDGQVTPSGITVNIYARTQVITTNDVSVGTKAIFVTP
jgi:hypothetical protein